jgi:hypothetical protein
MSTFNGLPAHVLLVHLIVVLVPLTSVLAIACAVSTAIRRRLVWLVVILAAITVVVTPIAADAGEWLEKRVGRTPALHTHTELGDTMIYFAIPLLAASLFLVIVQLRETRGRATTRLVTAAVAVLTIAAGIAATTQVYRIGETGASAVWSDVAQQSARTPSPR